jgi:hypothetical protein
MGMGMAPSTLVEVRWGQGYCQVHQWRSDGDSK